MSDITLSKAVRSNLLNLQNTAGLLSKSQERLSSGLRVNTALDNPTNFFTAQGLNSRASDLSQLADAVSNAVQTVAAADKGITAITKLVESAQATARQALQTAAEVVTTPAKAAIPHAPVVGAAFGATVADTMTINGVDVDLTVDMSKGAVIAKINEGRSVHGVTASDTGDHITLTASTNGSANPNGNINIGGVITGTGFSTGTNAGTPPVVEVTGPNPKRQELVETYNDLLGQINALAKDASFNGVNLLNGDDLSVLFNEDGSSKIDIKGVDNTFAGLGLETLADDAFNSNAGVNTVLDSLKGVIDTLRSQSAKFGSNLSVVETRQDFTKQMINVLQTGAANLTLADTNEEAANVLALQTRQQLSSTALSLASQADQNVLRLF
jgi:flagellin